MFVRTSRAKKVRELGFYFHILFVHNEFPMSFNGRVGSNAAGWDTVQCIGLRVTDNGVKIV